MNSVSRRPLLGAGFNSCVKSSGNETSSQPELLRIPLLPLLDGRFRQNANRRLPGRGLRSWQKTLDNSRLPDSAVNYGVLLDHTPYVKDS